MLKHPSVQNVMSTKPCIHCNIVKPLSDFYKDRRKLDGVLGSCKSCVSSKEKLAYKRKKENNKLKIRELKNTQLQRLYGVSIDTVETKHKEQDGCCAICNTPILLFGDLTTKYQIACVDHNHQTGAVRGLLCNKCNRGLGFFNDNASLLKDASQYLEKYNG